MARASRSTQLANYFYWYLSVECSEGKDKLKYDRIRLRFLEGLKTVRFCRIPWSLHVHLSLIASFFSLQSSKRKWQKRYRMLIQQELLLGELKAIMAIISNLKDDRPKRVGGR